jgi:hypothetical protein
VAKWKADDSSITKDRRREDEHKVWKHQSSPFINVSASVDHHLTKSLLHSSLSSISAPLTIFIQIPQAFFSKMFALYLRI